MRFPIPESLTHFDLKQVTGTFRYNYLCDVLYPVQYKLLRAKCLAIRGTDNLSAFHLTTHAFTIYTIVSAGFSFNANIRYHT